MTDRVISEGFLFVIALAIVGIGLAIAALVAIGRLREASCATRSGVWPNQIA